MKARRVLSCAFFLLASLYYGQINAQIGFSGFTYQAVIRDAGAPLSNEPVVLRLTIRQSGMIEFQEEHTETTNQYGLVWVTVGQGNPIVNNFVDIDWGASNNPYTLRVEANIQGAGFVLLGERPIWAVPYSIYAKEAETVRNLNFNLGDLQDVVTPAPMAGDVLKYTGSMWIASPDSGASNLVAGPGISISNDTIINIGDANPNDDITTSTPAGGDLAGSYPNPSVIRIQGRMVSSNTPAVGEILKWNGSEWVPGTDLTSGGGGGSVNVTARLIGDGSPGAPLDIAPQNASLGQVLKWNGSNWSPANDSGQTYGLSLVGNTLSLVPGGSMSSITLNNNQYVGGPGILISGNTIINTGDTLETDDIKIGTAAGGDLDGFYPNPEVVRLRGNGISSQNPLPNQILKFNGLQWVPAIDETVDGDSDPINELQTLSYDLPTNTITLSPSGGSVTLPTYLEGAGIDITNFVITNTGDIDPANDITDTTPAGGDLSGVYPNPTVVKIHGFDIANTNPTTGQIYKYLAGQWVPHADSVADDDNDPINEAQTLSQTGNTITLTDVNGTGGGSITIDPYIEGAGIDITNNIITNTGDLNGNDDVLVTDMAGGDVSGTFSNLTVERIQNFPVSNATPANNEVLRWTGSQWVAEPDSVIDDDANPTNEIQTLSIVGDSLFLSDGGSLELPIYTAGPGINIDGNDVITNTGDLNPDNDVLVTDNAGGDVSGVFSNMTVERLQNVNVSNSTPATSEVLRYNGSQWEAAADSVIDDDANPTNEIQSLSIVGDSVFLSNGGEIELPIYTAGDGISIDGNDVVTNTGDLNPDDDVLKSDLAGGDVSGIYSNLTVERLQTVPISNSAPVASEVLRYNGSQWEPAADSVIDDDANPTNEIQSLSIVGDSVFLSNGGEIELPIYTAGAGINIDGNDVVTNTGDLDPGDDVLVTDNAGGDVSGVFSNMTVERLQNVNVSNSAPATSEVLRYNGSQWEAAADSVIDDDANPTNEIQSLSIVGDSVFLSNGGEIELPIYTAGAGINIDGNDVVTNTGDLDPGDDVLVTDNAGGDVSGVFSNMTVERLQNVNVSNSAPATSEVLRYNGSQWEAAADSVIDDDANPTNEIQSLSIVGDSVFLSNGGEIELPIYTAGAGINIDGNDVVTNTGDLDPGDDVLVTDNAGGDVSGVFSNMTVERLQNVNVSNSAPATSEVLRYNGSQWEAAADSVIDDDANPTNEIQSLSIVGDSVFLSNGGEIELPIYTAGAGINIDGNDVVTNTGDLDPGDDVLVTDNAGGDVSGVFSNMTVERLQNVNVSNSVPATSEVLRYNGSQWEASADSVIDDDANPTNEIQSLSIVGDSVFLSNGGEIELPIYTAGTGINIDGNDVVSNTGDVNPNDDVLVTDNAGGDVSGVFSNMTVERLQNVNVSNSAPATSEVLRYNGSQWEAAADSVIDDDANPTNEIQSLSIVGDSVFLSNGGEIELPIYTAGTGINIDGNDVVTNTGDVNPSDDVLVTDNAGGDVSGVFSNMTVEKLQNVDVSNSTPTTSEVLRYNGSQWEPAADSVIDDDANPTNEIQSLSIVGDSVFLSNGGEIELPIYTAGSGIFIDGNDVVSNTGDVNPSDDVLVTDNAGGDIDGVFSNMTVERIQNQEVSNATPSTGEVLKWNGTQWEAAPDDTVHMLAGPGVSIINNVISNTGDLDPGDDITNVTPAGGDLTGIFPNLQVSGLNGEPLPPGSPAAPGQILKWDGVNWTFDDDFGQMYQSGDGINLNGNIIENIGDTDSTNDIINTTVAGGDVTGVFSSLSVTHIQGNQISNSTPLTNEVLKWNGTQWEAMPDDTATYNGGTGIDITGSTITNTGDTNPGDDVLVTDNAGGDVSGNFSSLTVEGIKGQTLPAGLPGANQIMKWDGSNWIYDDDQGTIYTAGSGIDVTGTLISNTGDVDPDDDVLITDNAGGDASGVFGNLTVTHIQNNPILAATPLANEVLKWNGTQWEPMPDDTATYNGGVGIDVSGGVITNTGDTNPGDDVLITDNAGGDVSGFFSALTVNGIKGQALPAGLPGANQIMKWDGSNWIYDDDQGTIYNGGTGIDVSGTTITNTGDTDPDDDVLVTDNAGGDATGVFGNLTVTHIQNNPILAATPLTNEVLKWNGSQWEPMPDDTATYNGGVGIDVSGGVITNTGDVNPLDDILTTTIAGGDVSGTYSGLTVQGLKGQALPAGLPGSDQIIKWDGSNWIYDDDQGTIYNAGGGIDISGNTITNTGDTDASDDVLVTDNAGGDATGVFGNLTVTGIQNQPISGSVPLLNEVLKWDGSQWIASTDAVDDADASTTNEIQGLSISGNTLSLSLGGGSVNLPEYNYTGGTGIDVSGFTIENTGDTDPSDDVLVTDNAGGDVNGTFSALTVTGLNGQALPAGLPGANQILKWNGTNWFYDNDQGTTYTAGPGITIAGNVVTNVGDVNASDDVLVTDNAGGDVSGTFSNLTVESIQNEPISNSAPLANEVLKYDGVQWEPGTDEVDDADADPSNEFQTISISGSVLTLSDGGGSVNIPDNSYNAGTGINISGSTIENTGDVNALDDITTSSIAGGDATGTFSALTVTRIQNQLVSNSIPATNEVLQYDGSQWEPVILNVDDADANSTNEIQSLSIAGNVLSLSLGGGSVNLPDNSYNAGTGINISGSTIENTGDTDGSDDVLVTDNAAGDVSGTFSNLTVERLQNNDVSGATPNDNEVLKWNSANTEWEPATDSVNNYSVGAGLSLTGLNLVNTGDTDGTDDVLVTDNAGGDVNGTFSSLTVNSIQNNPVASGTPGLNRILKWDGAQWDTSVDEVNDADADPINEIQTLSIAGTVLSLSSGGGSVNLPTDTYTAGTGISISSNEIVNTGDTDASDDITNTTAATNDLSGTYPSPTVVGIQNNPVTSSTPGTDDVLRWNGTNWLTHIDTDSSEVNELQNISLTGSTLTLSDGGGSVLLPTTPPIYTSGSGINIDGAFEITNTGDTLASDDITITTPAANDLSGTYPAPTVVGIQNNPVSASTPATNDVLRWDGSSWNTHVDTDSSETNELQSLSVTGTNVTISGGNTIALPYNGGTGIALSGATILNTGDVDGSDDVLVTDNAGGDVSGTFSNLTVDRIQGQNVSNATPMPNEVLKFIGGQWEAAADENTTYSAGVGINLSGTTIENTGDINPADDITNTTGAAGDVTGTFSTLTVEGLQNRTVSNAAPSNDEVLKWNNALSQWEPGADSVNNYTVGAGLSLSGLNIVNTGDVNAADDILNTTNAAGDVSGTFGALTVEGLQSRDVSNAAPNDDEVLKWNNALSQWEPASDSVNNYTVGAGLSLSGLNLVNTGDVNAADDILNTTIAAGDVTGTFGALTVERLQTRDVSNAAPSDDEVLKWNNALSQWEPASDSVNNYTVGAGLSLSGLNLVNTGDVNAADDILNTTIAAGDVTGTFGALTVERLQTRNVSNAAPSDDEVLKWNNALSQWEPSTDSVNTYTVGAGLSLSGLNLVNTGDVNAADDILNTTIAAGDVTGTFGALTVERLQTRNVSNAAPSDDEVLKWNNALSQWEPASDSVNNYTVGAGLSLSGLNLVNTGDVNAADDILNTTIAAGDVTGTFGALTVESIQNVNVSSTAPVDGQFLRYNNGATEWTAAQIFSSDVDVDGDIIPDLDSTRSLGTAALRWKDAFIANGVTMTSDARLKDNIQDLEYGLDEIMKMRPVIYNWKQDAAKDGKLGLIAQELLGVVDEVVTTHVDQVNPETGKTEKVELDIYGVNYSELIPVLIKGMQEQQESIEQQQELLKQQMEMILELKNEIQTLKQD